MLIATPTATGFDVDLTLTAADLAIPYRVYDYELLATFGGEVRTLVAGDITVDQEPTS